MAEKEIKKRQSQGRGQGQRQGRGQARQGQGERRSRRQRLKQKQPPRQRSSPASRAWLEFYRTECVPRMMQEFKYKSSMQVPRLEKIVVNLGLGEAIQNIKLLESAQTELTDHRRPKSGGDPGQEVHRGLQA